jgi:hypothetical protein
MRTSGTDFDLQSLVQSESRSETSTSGMGNVYPTQLAYHEMADIPVQETDLLEQLESNMKRLSDLQSRMQFMMREIRYLMKV